MEGGNKVMSNNVDRRVVEMEFDNRNFESNVNTTIGSLDRLRKSLNLPSASTGLELVGEASKKVNLTPLINAVETVH
jgi:hypothetical protein